jgi:hypothetical protein
VALVGERALSLRSPPVTPDEAAVATAGPIGSIASHFMVDAATYAKGAELGFEGMDFYVVGRGGALGEVDADVVTAAFVFFNPAAVRESWERGRQVMTPADAAAEFTQVSADWARSHVPADFDAARLAELAGKVIAGASPAGAPLFAGFRALPEPTEPMALAIHRMNALRELRGARHEAAVLVSGIEPLDAVMVKTPYMAGIFGWPEPHPDPTPAKDAWEAAEARTNAMMAAVLAVLDEAELDEFVELTTTLAAAVG